MTVADRVHEARGEFARGRWAAAYSALAASDADDPLEPADLELLASAAFLVGRAEESATAYERAHDAWLAAGDWEAAARSAFWLAFDLLQEGQPARAGAWGSRVAALVGERDSVWRGYLRCPEAVALMDGGEPARARDLFAEALETGRRFDDVDLQTLGLLGCGQTRLQLGDPAGGLAQLDECMLAVLADETSPQVSGLVYCAVIEACRRVVDVHRAREWTAALSRWCATHGDVAPYRGTCLVHRSEILTFHGAWAEARTEVTRACEQFRGAPGPGAGAALYQLGELHRLAGDLVAAERAYRQAAEVGHDPQPGLGLLRSAQGREDAALAGLGRALAEAVDAGTRARLLAATVEVALTAGGVAVAREAADDLRAVADTLRTPLPGAMSDRAQGAVLLAESRPTDALPRLRRAWTGWDDADCPYEAARTRLLVADACEALGDEDAARMERHAAQQVLASLGTPSGGVTRGPDHLSPRELEVLRLLASGLTNREIAAELTISEKTVARHLSNIFAKVGVGTRSAATAYAFRHDLA